MSRKAGRRSGVRSSTWCMSRLGVTQAGTVSPWESRMSGNTGPRAAAGSTPLMTGARRAPSSRAVGERPGDITALSSRPLLALRAKLEGLVEGLGLARILAGDGTFLRVGSDKGVGLALLGALIDVEHGVIDHLVDDRADDECLLPAVACRPDAALLASRRSWGGLDKRLGGAASRGHFELRLLGRRLVGGGFLGC